MLSFTTLLVNNYNIILTNFISVRNVLLVTESHSAFQEMSVVKTRSSVTTYSFLVGFLVHLYCYLVYDNFFPSFI